MKKQKDKGIKCYYLSFLAQNIIGSEKAKEEDTYIYSTNY